MRMQKTLPLLLAALLLFTACEEKKTTPRGSTFVPEGPLDPNLYDVPEDGNWEEEETAESECTRLCDLLSTDAERLEGVRSPDALIAAKKQHQQTVTEVKQGMTELDGEEKSLVNAGLKAADAAYAQACTEYEIPASGVIANLSHLIGTIDGIRTEEEFHRFQDCRLGMLRHLDDIHLCVEQRSKQIPEVKRLAQTLKRKYETKKTEFGIR